MATLPAEEKVEFLIQLIASLGDFKPNYGVLAEAMGINTNANAQRRFKGIVEADKKFVLQCSKDATSVVMAGDGDTGEGNGDTTSTPKKTPASGKGRKRTKPANADDDEQTKTPSKVSKKTQKDKVEKLNEERNEDDQEDVSQNDDVI